MVRRWSRLSNFEKFDAYTRWSVYLLAAMLPMILMSWALEQRTDRPALRVAFWLCSVALAIACLVTIWQVIGKSRRVKRLSPLGVAAVIVTCAACIVLALLTWPSPDSEYNGLRWVVLVCLGFAVASTTITLPLRWTIAIALALTAALGVLFARIGSAEATQATVGALLLFGSAIGAVRASVMMLDLMYRIDRSRHIESQLAVAEERLRFARDLHDTLGHNLSAIALKSQVARAQIGRDAAAAEREVDAVRSLADESLAEMRAVVRGYRDADLDAEIAGAKSLLASAGIDCVARGSADRADELAWVVREGVTNVIRHSNATRCTIDVSSDDGRASVRLWNDGARGDSRGGTGIAGLRDRLVAVGGTLEVGRPRSGEFEIVATKDLSAKGIGQ